MSERLEFSPIFRRSLEGITAVLRREFNLGKASKPDIEATFYDSRNAIIKAIQQSGDPKNVLPFFGVKISSVFPDVEAQNSRMLKRQGIPLYYEGETTGEGLSLVTLFARPTRVEADVIFLTDSYDEVLQIIQQIIFLGSELPFKVPLGKGGIPVKMKINKDGLAMPEADFESSTANYELTFSLYLKTYIGIEESVPMIERVRVQGGPIITVKSLKGGQRERVERVLQIGRGLNTELNSGDLNIVDIPIEPDTDLVRNS